MLDIVCSLGNAHTAYDGHHDQRPDESRTDIESQRSRRSVPGDEPLIKRNHRHGANTQSARGPPPQMNPSRPRRHETA